MPAMNTNNDVSVAIAGAAGRMGQRLCAMAVEMDGLTLGEAFDAPGHPALGQAATQGCAVRITDQFGGPVDVLIDFSIPAVTRQLIDQCVAKNTAMIIGTTGLSDDDQAAIDEAGQAIPVIHAPNFSLVVNVLTMLAAKAAQLLGEPYDIEILEAHHRFKKDAPSGTALSIARRICDATGRSYDDDVVFTRHGDEVVRRKGEITMQTLRLGDAVGEHTVYYATLGERLELRHVGTSRDSYVIGALRAAKWLGGKPAGRYTMADVLGLAG
jgi:4-hydroxy-tetrahydrodipicolinate reductase